MYAKKGQYTLTDDGETMLQERLEYAVAHKDHNFGNARYVRNVFEKAIQEQANRLAGRRNLTATQLSTLEASDLRKAFEGVKLTQDVIH